MKLGIKAALIAALTALALWTPAANAGSVVLTLTRTTLNNVPDAAGTWQYEGGNIFKGTVKVGQYALTRRSIIGGTTTPLNTAATTITLFFALASGTAPQNVTLQGAHDFTIGNFRGSVSAASGQYGWIKGADAVYSVPAAGHETLTISWTASPQLTLP
jgi:hypothetical protein